MRVSFFPLKASNHYVVEITRKGTSPFLYVGCFKLVYDWLYLTFEKSPMWRKEAGTWLDWLYINKVAQQGCCQTEYK